MAITTDISLLEATKRKVANMEKQIAAKLSKELASLPAAYGFKSVEEFLDAVKSAGGARKSKARVAAAPKAKARRKRAVITDAVRADVKKRVQAGESGAKIAKALGISLPTVQNIKKALGLVKGAKKAAAKQPAPKAKKPTRKAAKKAAAKPAKEAAPKPAPAPKPEAVAETPAAEAPKTE